MRFKLVSMYQHSYDSLDDIIATSKNNNSYGLGTTFQVWLYTYNQRDNDYILIHVKIKQLCKN